MVLLQCNTKRYNPAPIYCIATFKAFPNVPRYRCCSR
jgi:hypothetical protein